MKQAPSRDHGPVADPQSSMKRLWVLNLDAERELALSGGYSRPRAMAAQIEEQTTLIGALCEGEPVLRLDASTPPEGATRETVVVAWSPTPSALALVRRVGLKVPAAPPVEVLKAANHRRFQHEIARSVDPGGSPFLEHSGYVEPAAATDLAAQVEGLAERLSELPPIGRGYHLERAYGFAGKGARRLSGAPKPDDVRWLRDSLERGGVLVEPWVDVTTELSLHGFVDAEGALFGEPCIQECDRFGAPSRVAVLDPRTANEAVQEALPRLRDAAARAATALLDIGYFGPFGIDAFVWKDGPLRHLNPLSDLNARFTLGWSTGMGSLREAALERASGLTLVAFRGQ